MNKTVFTLFFCFFILNTPFAQNVICGHDMVRAKMEKLYPGYQKSIDKSFEDAKAHSSILRQANTTYTIPVVVHVVWKEEAEQIDSSLILSQIEILNEDFQRLNDDADNIRAEFSDVVGSAMINFELKEIIYVQTESIYETSIFGSLPDDVKFSDQGGSDAVNPEMNLNMWVCKIQPLEFAGDFAGQLLGYAYPPNDLSNWPEDIEFPEDGFEGIVVDYRTVGRNNPVPIQIFPGEEMNLLKGRTAVHEVGHYLGLRHVWGDQDPATLVNSCNVDDGIEDTPNSSVQSLFDCDLERNSCNSGANDLPDMIENFMDSASEDCQNSFTMGQIQLMRAVLETSRCMLVGACQDVATRQLIQTDITIQPNPSNGKFNIQSKDVILSNFDFIIFNSAGMSFPLNLTNNKSIDLSDFPAGIYFLQGQNETHRIQQKIIKL